ncbi:hypothetical protein IW262DRAFT_132790 [Armillaria fumosa]|nr:hypothetical protein IW262DRAFT_132790 [Armillaria fumosa]
MYYQQQNMYTQPSPITTADAPFNDPTDDVDLVIRTVDNVEFFVLNVLLTLRSPSSFFRHALQDSKHTEERDGLPVLEVTEDSDTFRAILLFCYPDITPELKSVEQFQAVGAALDKYCMDRPSRARVTHDQGTAVTGIRSRSRQWMEGDVEESNIITARHLYRLVTYHARCGKAAQIKGPYPWLRGNSGVTFLQHSMPSTSTPCRRCGKSIGHIAGGGLNFYGHSWLDRTYFPLVNSKLLLEPRPQVALDNDIIGLAIYASIQECSMGSWALAACSQIHRLGEIVAKEIDRRISEVPLDIEWKKMT